MVCLSCDYMQISHKSKERFDDCLFDGGRQNNKPHCPHFSLSISLGHSRSQSIRLEQPLRVFCWLLPCGPNQLNYMEGSLLMGRFWGRMRLKESLSLNPVYLFFFFDCTGSSLLCMIVSLVVVSRGYSPLVMCGLLIAVASLITGHRLWSTGFVVVVCRLSCSMACGIFLDQGSNPCLLHFRQILYHWANREVQHSLPWLAISCSTLYLSLGQGRTCQECSNISRWMNPPKEG